MPAQRKYPEELRERAVKMVLEIRAREGKGRGELARVGRQLGVRRMLRASVRGSPTGTASALLMRRARPAATSSQMTSPRKCPVTGA